MENTVEKEQLHMRILKQLEGGDLVIDCAKMQTELADTKEQLHSAMAQVKALTGEIVELRKRAMKVVSNQDFYEAKNEEVAIDFEKLKQLLWETEAKEVTAVAE